MMQNDEYESGVQQVGEFVIFGDGTTVITWWIGAIIGDLDDDTSNIVIYDSFEDAVEKLVENSNIEFRFIDGND